MTSGEATLHYYLGDKQVALKKGSTLSYLHQEHLTSTSAVSDTGGASTGTIRYLPFGSQRSTTGAIPTDKKACAEPVEAFTGQRLDGTGLYYYNARYYDPEIGRFISADSLVPSTVNPQNLNRYSYVINNPLRYTDPSGHWFDLAVEVFGIAFDIQQLVSEPSWGNAGFLALDVALAFVPFVPGVAGISAKGAARGAGVIGKAKKAEKVIEGVDKAAEGAKAAERATDEAGRLLALTEDNFRTNLMRLTSKSEAAVKGQQAHHVLPLKFEKEFERAGVKVNDPKFGAWVDSSHQKWGKAHNDRWEAFFTGLGDRIPSVEEIEEFAGGLAEEFHFGVGF